MKSASSIPACIFIVCLVAAQAQAQAQAQADGQSSAPAGQGASLAEENTPDPAEETPWAAGVPEAERDRANVLHARALHAAKELFYADALALYRQALTHWDHPKIRYNTAFVLIKLDQPIEARENLMKAVAHGERPLGPETYQNALNYLELLNKQLAEVVIHCSDPDVEVTLNGKLMLTGSGTTTRIVRPGNHQLVATTPRLPALVHRIPMWADQRHEIEVQPALARQQRWPTWQPWLVTGAGVAILAGGGALHWRAQAHFDQFDSLVSATCPLGCIASDLPDEALALERRATRLNYAAGGTLVTGGSLLLVGAILLVLNRPRLDEERAFQLSVMPMTAPGGLGLSARLPL